ncbi:hypothetical protein BACFRA24663_17100 [Bacteroides fragilis]
MCLNVSIYNNNSHVIFSKTHLDSKLTTYAQNYVGNLYYFFRNCFLNVGG